MTVFFIGAGPGAPDLITLRGRDIMARCPVCLHAGSLVAEPMLVHCGTGARIIDTAPLDLNEIEAICVAANADGHDVARLHSGDLAFYSAVAEQMARLARHGIACEMVPGVSAMGAASAALCCELTRPGIGQSVVVTRLSGRATDVPASERLEDFARTGALLALHLSVHRLAEIVERLTPISGEDCPVAVVERVSRSDERIWRGTLATILAVVGAQAPPRLAVVLVGRTLSEAGAIESALYATGYERQFRPGSGP